MSGVQLKDEESLELTFALKHIEQHLLQNDINTKKMIKLQQRIISKEKLISCKGAVKIYQAYESVLLDIENHMSTIDHALRICEVVKEQEQEKEQEKEQEHDQGQEKEKESTPPSIEIEEVDVTSNVNVVSSDHIPVGTLVAAFTSTSESDGTKEWILTRIISFGFEDSCYTVEDADVEEDPSVEVIQKEVYRVSEENIIIIPENEEEALNRVEFRLKQNVLALFPGTTCFYPSVVMSQPSRRKKTKDYLLKFSDDDVPSRQCAARYVLLMPSHSQKD